MKPLPTEFYLRDHVLVIAQELLGKVLETEINGIRCGGIISETEAYAGVDDRASHAFGGRRTQRNEAMYGEGGTAYVYLCYGIHHLFNVVTNSCEVPHAVLIRGVIPFKGIEDMALRRKLHHTSPRLSAGPGTLTQALGIELHHNMISLQSTSVRICDGRFEVQQLHIESTPRIGVDYAGEDALLPYRFMLKKPAADRIRSSVSGFAGNR